MRYGFVIKFNKINNILMAELKYPKSIRVYFLFIFLRRRRHVHHVFASIVVGLVFWTRFLSYLPLNGSSFGRQNVSSYLHRNYLHYFLVTFNYLWVGIACFIFWTVGPSLFSLSAAPLCCFGIGICLNGDFLHGVGICFSSLWPLLVVSELVLAELSCFGWELLASPFGCWTIHCHPIGVPHSNRCFLPVTE